MAHAPVHTITSHELRSQSAYTLLSSKQKLMKLIKTVLLLLTLWTGVTSEAQEVSSEGIKWTNGLTWDQLKEKAKQENKYIFVDCYTTWCKPCKYMDKTVYSNDTVAVAMNQDFLSMKLQMDKSSNDNEQIKSLYSTANLFENEYHVNSYPTFLFFNPSGRLVHKDIGAKTVPRFVLLANEALDEGKQFYRRVDDYWKSSRDYSKTPELAKYARKIGDDSLSATLSDDYLNNYVFSSTGVNEISKESLEFVYSIYESISSSSKAFHFFYDHADTVDKITGRYGQASRLINYVIAKEEIEPRLSAARKQGEEPAWGKMERTISSKYTKSIAVTNVLDAKINWCVEQRKWDRAISYSIQKVESFHLDTNRLFGIEVYNIATIILNHSQCKKELERALAWMVLFSTRDDDELIKIGSMDTYAGLLYKTGRFKEGLEKMKMYVELSKDREAAQLLPKMEKLQKIW
jgi:thioredoxin-related protein